MTISEQRVSDVTILEIAGDFDARTMPVANAKLDELLQGLRTQLVFDLSGVELVTSTAIGFLVDASKRTKRLGGETVLVALSPLFRKTLQMLKIDTLFKDFPTHGDAVGYLRDRALDDTVDNVKDEP